MLNKMITYLLTNWKGSHRSHNIDKIRGDKAIAGQWTA
jgi:hypothetical protein